MAKPRVSESRICEVDVEEYDAIRERITARARHGEDKHGGFAVAYMLLMIEDKLDDVISALNDARGGGDAG